MHVTSQLHGYCTVQYFTTHLLLAAVSKVTICDVNATPLYGTPTLVKDKWYIKIYLKETATVKKFNLKLRK
jgi:hypothetical protein